MRDWAAFILAIFSSFRIKSGGTLALTTSKYSVAMRDTVDGLTVCVKNYFDEKSGGKWWK